MPPSATPPRPRVVGWILLGAAAAVAGTVALWALRPTWTICFDGPEGGQCLPRVDSVAAVAGTTALVGLFAAIVITAALIRGRMRLPILVAAFLAMGLVIAAGAGFALVG